MFYKGSQYILFIGTLLGLCLTYTIRKIPRIYILIIHILCSFYINYYCLNFITYQIAYRYFNNTADRIAYSYELKYLLALLIPSLWILVVRFIERKIKK